MNRPSGVFVILPLLVLLGVAGSAGAQAPPSQDSPVQNSPVQDSPVRDSPAWDSPAQVAAVAMVETILAGDDGEPAWDALASALGARSAREGAELAPGAGSATHVTDLASKLRASPPTAETLAIVGVLALLSVAAIAVALGSIRGRRALANPGGGRLKAGRGRRFRLGSGRSGLGGGRSRSGPVCRDAARLEAHLRTRRSA